LVQGRGRGREKESRCCSPGHWVPVSTFDTHLIKMSVLCELISHHLTFMIPKIKLCVDILLAILFDD
jgi:hypothetical protein